MKRHLGSSIVVGLCAAFFGIAALAAGAQVAGQGAALQDLRHPQPAQMPVAGMAVVPEDLSRVPLAEGDVLDVEVFDAPDVSGIYGVDSSGDLTLPLVGKIRVSGLTTPQAQAKIAAAFKDGSFILNPNVTLTIQQYVPTYVTIVGEVQTPGRFPLLAPHSVQQVLALAGGQTLFASGSVEIKRKVNGTEELVDMPIPHGSVAAANESEILPGDLVTVKRSGMIYVLGGVFRPGGYLMQERGSLDLLQAIALANGTTMQAAIRSMRIVRRNPDGSVAEIPVDYRAMVAGKVPPMVLRSQDVVYVPISKFKAALSGGAPSVLGATSAAAIYVAR